MNKKKAKKVIRNYVAKYMVEVLKPVVHVEKKKLQKSRKAKHKRDYRDEDWVMGYILGAVALYNKNVDKKTEVIRL